MSCGAQLVRQLAFAQEFGAHVHFAVVAAEDRHVGPSVAFAVGGVPAARPPGPPLRAGWAGATMSARLAVAPAADGFEQGHAVVVLVFGGQQVGGHEAGGLQNLPRVGG